MARVGSYDKEFKESIIQYVLDHPDETYVSVGKRFDVHSTTIGGCMKEYKENPDNYRGSTADISNVIRVALTTKLTTPDLYEIINILGDAEVRSRFSKICG